MLKDIKETILKDSRKDGETTLRKAEAEVEAEFAKVKDDGEMLVAKAESEARAVVENEKRERQSWAKIEAKRIVMEAREDAVNAAFDDLVERIKRYTGTKAYAERMRKKISDAAIELGEKCVIHVKKGEKKLLSLNGAEVREDADILGGAIVESKDGRMRIDLSMEAMLEAQRDSIRKDIYARLFREK